MRSPSRPRSFFVAPVAFAALLAVLGMSAEARPRPGHRPAAGQRGTQPAFIGGAEDGQSMIRQPSGVSSGTPGSAAIGAGGAGTYARSSYIGSGQDGQSMRRRQPRHHGGHHSHQGH